MRAAGLLLLLASCGGSPPADPVNRAADAMIDCRPQGEAAFAHACTLETSADGRLLTLRKPDGGFRRLRVAADGGIVAADGAERAQSAPRADGRIEVAIGGDHFLLPAGVVTR